MFYWLFYLHINVVFDTYIDFSTAGSLSKAVVPC